MDINDLAALNASKQWSEIIELTSDITESSTAPHHFFRGNAFLNAEEFTKCEEALVTGLKINNANSWGQSLLLSCRIKGNINVDKGFDDFFNFITLVDSTSEGGKAFFVDEAVKHGKFYQAAIINEMRHVISGHPLMPKFAIAVQCFNKADTLDKVFENLCRCDGTNEFSLVILQDSLVGSTKKDKYLEGVNEVKDKISEWLPLLMSCFGSVEILSNSENLGTAPSCRRLLDYVCNKYEGFMFIEDDCLVSEDALLWALVSLNKFISPYKYWFSTCESIFFNSAGKHVSDTSLHKLNVIAKKTDIANAYVELDFVPSTCFITSSEVWKICGKVRSFVRGPESLTAFVQASNKKTLSPLVPRANDIGMLHENGYSVDMLGAENVKEAKTTYLTSLCSDSREQPTPTLYKGNVDRLYASTVKLDNSQIDIIYQEQL
jgi:hypothetical protein